MVRGDNDRAALGLVDRAVSKCGPRCDRLSSPRQYSPPDIKRNLSQDNDNPNIQQVRELRFKMRLASGDFFRRRFVVGRRAAHRSGDKCIGQQEAVINRLRGWNVRETVTMHRGHQEIARSASAIPCENAPGAICSMRSRRETENEHSRVRIAKPRDRFAPVNVIAKGGPFHSSDFATIGA